MVLKRDICQWHRLKEYAQYDREKKAKVFKNGRNRAVRIPRDFDFVGEEVTIYQEGGRLILEPIRSGGLLALLDGMEPIDTPFPDVDEDLLPLDSVNL